MRSVKKYLVRKNAWGTTLDGRGDPWGAAGVLSTRVLDVANSYLGLWSKLAYVDLWYTPPAGPRRRDVCPRSGGTGTTTTGGWSRCSSTSPTWTSTAGPLEYVPGSLLGGPNSRNGPGTRSARLPAGGRV